MVLRSTWTLQTRSTSRLASLQISLFLSKPFIYFGFSTELLWFPVFFAKISWFVLFIFFSRYIQGWNEEYNHIHLFLQVSLWPFCRSYSSVILLSILLHVNFHFFFEMKIKTQTFFLKRKITFLMFIIFVENASHRCQLISCCNFLLFLIYFDFFFWFLKTLCILCVFKITVHKV